MNKNHIKSDSIFKKRIRKFKSIKRGYYALIILSCIFLFSILAPLFINDQALYVRYNNKSYFPFINQIVRENSTLQKIFKAEIYWPGGNTDQKIFGDETTTSYRLLKKKFNKEKSNNYVIMPIYPYGPIENKSLLELNEPFVDQGNGKWDKGEKFIDTNNNKNYDDAEDFIDSHKFIDINKNGIYDEIPNKDLKRLKKYIKNDFWISKEDGYWDDKTLTYIQSLQSQGISGRNIQLEKYLSPPNGIYDIGERFTDKNNNGKWDDAEKFTDIGNKIYNEGEKYTDIHKNGTYDKFSTGTRPNWVPKLCSMLGLELSEGTAKSKYTPNILGTDENGRDVFARIVYGFKTSFLFALIVWFLSYTLGISIGAMFGYKGGKIDLFGYRIIEIYSSIPFMFMLMILATFMKPNIFILACMYVILSGWIGISWYVRGEFLREKSKDYVSAAVSMGQSHTKIIFKHILPNALTSIITNAPFVIVGYITSLVALDYLGFGLQPPTPSWGNLIAQGHGSSGLFWHLVLFPLLGLGITLFLISLIGEAVREAFDPKVHSRLR